MEAHRTQELNFLVRTGSPVPLTESRANAIFEDNTYDDFYTIKELIEEDFLEYVGKDQNFQLFLRPRKSFSVYIMNEVCLLKSGEIVKLALTKAGQIEFESWIQTYTPAHK